MLDREIVLTDIYPELAALIPAAGEARVERPRRPDLPRGWKAADQRPRTLLEAARCILIF
jgi:hypothetical protein